MTRLLVEAGEALYGPQWQSALARDLDVSARTVRRWAAGSHQPPDGIYAELLRLVSHRAQTLGAVSERLRATGRE